MLKIVDLHQHRLPHFQGEGRNEDVAEAPPSSCILRILLSSLKLSRPDARIRGAWERATWL